MVLSMSSGPKFQSLEHLAEIGRALGSAHRLELLEHVAQGERSVERLAALTGLSLANASHHLLRLRRAGLVQSRRAGKHVLYRVGGGAVEPLLLALRAQAEHTGTEMRALVRDYFTDTDSMEPVARDELVRRLGADEVVLLDVRPDDEFRAGHLPGALNYPLTELEKRLGELPTDKEIIAYCRGPYCILSAEAVALLRGRGFKVRRFEEGVSEWKAAGLTLEAAA